MPTAVLPPMELPVRVRRASSIAEHLKSMILEGTLKPGDRLPTEEQLCQHFGVSRTTLRESVQMLRVTGLLDVSPGRGSYVRAPTVDAILSSIVLVGSADATNRAELKQLQSHLMIDMARRACAAPLEVKKHLATQVVGRGLLPEENVKVERSWQLGLADAARAPLMKGLLEAILKVLEGERLATFRDAALLQRHADGQLRVNAALHQNVPDQAARLMGLYMGLPTALVQPASFAR